MRAIQAPESIAVWNGHVGWSEVPDFGAHSTNSSFHEGFLLHLCIAHTVPRSSRIKSGKHRAENIMLDPHQL